ncbi:amino acid ABC transporter substrate-binding protein [Oceaniovalibus sp. ACAM 378]|uniref:amino acid ABC transporter substrate-binding protein n=1 Tax=Oceaniovalibus sp. ACAM 378 TaxID=2599923 RepID=UPI0011D71362|nr:amino acid ABC transporter substrate-binding protein [Oceaniovalibus sp. ACAM 378]TYB89438.1 amino acid ABC transporter substrate-binding protein [Oceaniovalibus sp. ACAM 378]
MLIGKKLAAIAFAAGLGLGVGLPAFAQDLTGTLKKISDSGEIVIGHRESSVPFSYLDSDQKPIGYSIDICARIVDEISTELGKEISVRYVPINPKTRIPLLANGTINMECGSTTNTLTRQQQVEYLPTTFITGTKILTKTDSGINSIDDLGGKIIGLAPGTTNDRVIREEAEKRGIDVDFLVVNDHAEGMLALETGRADAYSTDHILLFGLIETSKSPDDFAVVGDFLSYDPYALMVPRDDSAFELIGKRALANLFRTGEINDIYAKWFDPMGIEQTPLLQAAFQLATLPE